MSETKLRNEVFEDLANGAFSSGLQNLSKLTQWQDDSENLDGPFFLGFPGVNGWGEGLLVSSLLKRHAVASKRRIKAFAVPQVCSVLKYDAAFELNEVKDFEVGRQQGARSPLAILKAALIGNLLQYRFVPIETGTSLRPPIQGDLLIGIAWASVSNGSPIPGKCVPLLDFLKIFGNGDNNYYRVVSFQRHLCDTDQNILRKQFKDRFSAVPTDLLDQEDQTQVVSEIQRLDYMITISTTTAHIAACLGVPVILLAARRGGPQWFWCAQSDYGRRIYDSVTIDLGDKGNGWWKSPVLAAQEQLVSIPLSKN